MAVRVLSVLVAFMVLYGCGQASTPVEKQEKGGGVEEAEREEPTNIPTAASSAPATASVGPSGPSISKEEAAAQAEANCRILAYVQEQNMSQQEAEDFSTRLANETADRMIKDDSLPDSITAGPVENQVLDDLDVPRYPECKGATEE